jgi:hypothetical protein
MMIGWGGGGGGGGGGWLTPNFFRINIFARVGHSENYGNNSITKF